jgi:hypothetical protein
MELPLKSSDIKIRKGTRMELTALRRLLSDYSTDESTDLQKLLEAVDLFREHLEVMELDIRYNQEDSVAQKFGFTVCKSARELMGAMLGGSMEVRQIAIESVINSYGPSWKAELEGEIARREEREEFVKSMKGGLGDLDDHPF